MGEVGAEEAYGLGLVNLLAEPGGALTAARGLAHRLASFPQGALRNDRRSVLEQWALSGDEAMRNELRLGLETVASGESRSGAARFASGEGRYGSG